MPYYVKKPEEIIAELYSGSEESITAIQTLLKNINATATKKENSNSLLIKGAFGQFILNKNEYIVLQNDYSASKMSYDDLNRFWTLKYGG